jgi:antitoxin (DNA-binding transcriptional repressor) of toxin-antitoxin stability system
MIKVGIADLRAHLSEHLRKVCGGHSLTVLNRSAAIARIVPFDEDALLGVRRATRKPASLRLPPAPSTPADSLSLLLKDRASG